MFKICKACKHIIEDENHVCPSAEYVQAKQDLIDSAIESEVPEESEDECRR